MRQWKDGELWTDGSVSQSVPRRPSPVPTMPTGAAGKERWRWGCSPAGSIPGDVQFAYPAAALGCWAAGQQELAASSEPDTKSVKDINDGGGFSALCFRWRFLLNRLRRKQGFFPACLTDIKQNYTKLQKRWLCSEDWWTKLISAMSNS